MNALTPEQETLLATLVEARQQALPSRVEFDYTRVLSPVQHIYVLGDGANQQIPLDHEPDLLYLVQTGMLHTYDQSRGSSFWFDITPAGLRYYEAMKQRMGSPARQIEADIVAFLDDARFREAYPGAAEKWSEAAKMLWAADSERALTRIGHECREALILFGGALVERFEPAGLHAGPRNVVGRIRAVIECEARRLGKTERSFVDALVAYCHAVNELVQRQEHGAEKEGDQVRWRDARRVVFQTAIVMYEVADALGISGDQRAGT